MHDDTVARRIRAFRKLKGMTQREFADRLGVSISIVGAIERGTRMPDRDILARIYRVLDISEKDLQESSSAQEENVSP
jgi:transcriptional regulator with XRE-family HTH domain